MDITIKDVAREAGVSIGTVSKALNDSYTISGEVTARIKDVANRLNYHPNARAQTLARRANREVTFLTALPRDVAFQNPHMFEIMVGAERALNTKNYALKLLGCNKNDVCSLTSEIVDGKHSDGLLFHVSVVTRELAILLTSREIPHIVIGKPDFGNSLCWIDNNNKLAGELAVGYLLETGHRTFSFIGGDRSDKISQNRLEGVKIRLKDSGAEPEQVIVFEGESSVISGAEMATALIKSSTLPDAVICANNLLAFGCLRALQTHGIRVPKELSLITFDDYPLAQLTDPMLTTVSIDIYEIGVQAGKLLASKIKKPQMQVQTFSTMPKLIVRESTGRKI